MAPSPPIAVGTAEHFRWLFYILLAVLAFNVIDAGLTLLWVRQGWATEANFLLEHLVHHPVQFLFVKMGLAGLSLTFLWLQRTRPLAVIGIFVIFLVYYVLMLHHFEFAAMALISDEAMLLALQ